MTTEKTTGTCPCCFETVQLRNGKIIRHGWKVQGDRRVGQYHASWHTGPCFGVGYEPFEVSCRGTVDYFHRDILPRGASVLKEIERLATRPDFIREYRGSYVSYQTYAMYAVRFRATDVAVDRKAFYTAHTAHLGYDTASMFANIPSYEEVLTAALQEQNNLFISLCDFAVFLCGKVTEWKPGKVGVVAPKKAPVIHSQSSKNRNFTTCGYRAVALMGGRTLKQVSHDVSQVTCPECQARMKASA